MISAMHGLSPSRPRSSAGHEKPIAGESGREELFKLTGFQDIAKRLKLPDPSHAVDTAMHRVPRFGPVEKMPHERIARGYLEFVILPDKPVELFR